MLRYPLSQISSCKEKYVGRDNHPRMRQKQKLERQKAKYASYDRILVVCEGKKTEPQYFEEIRKFYKLQTANVKIMPSSYGTAPQQVIDFASDELQKTFKWEYIFCVFDRDDHLNFNNALKSADALDKKFQNELGECIRFNAIPSIPCFELWLLLHFDCISKETHRDEVLRQLRHPKCLPKYEKGKNGIFIDTRSRLSTAFENAQKLAMQRNRHTIENPFTAVGNLVKYLIELSDNNIGS